MGPLLPSEAPVNVGNSDYFARLFDDEGQLEARTRAVPVGHARLRIEVGESKDRRARGETALPGASAREGVLLAGERITMKPVFHEDAVFCELSRLHPTNCFLSRRLERLRCFPQ